MRRIDCLTGVPLAMPICQGTSLIIASLPEGVVAAVDDLIYTLGHGEVVPASTGVRKVFVRDNVMVASTQLIRGRFGEPVPTEYDFSEWVAEFVCLPRGSPKKNPSHLAEALHRKMIGTFEPIERLIVDGHWGGQGPGNRIVSYFVAGYSTKFIDFQLLELGVEINAAGNGLNFLPPKSHLQNFMWTGEDTVIEQAMSGIEPYFSIREKLWSDQLERISGLLPRISNKLQDAAASLVSLIKTEAQFNPSKVGKSVNIALIDPQRKGTHTVTL